MSLAKPFYCFLLILSFSGALHAEELIGTPIAPDTGHEQIADKNELTQEDTSKNIEDDDSEKKSHKNNFRINGKVIDDWKELDGVAWGGIMIAILAIIVSLGGPLILVGFIVFLIFRSRANRREQINQNIDKLIAAGRDVPPELLLANGTRHSNDTDLTDIDNRTLNKGIKNIGWGVGLLIFLTIMAGFKTGSVGFILIALGISRIIIWKMAIKTQAASDTKPSLEDNSRTEN